MRTGKSVWRARNIAVCGLAAVAITLSGCSALVEPPKPGGFYRIAKSQIIGPPGEILKVEAFGGAPVGSSAYRVLYRSTGLDNEPIAVSGIIVVPEGAVPQGGRPVIAWAHPTTGVANRCAPSLMSGFFKSIKGLPDMLAQGYVVAATDYPGLGTDGTHPYLVGTSEGRAVLDSVKAARRLPQAEAGSKFAVWGHSQGGHAVLFAGQLAASYAPDLKLAGVAAAAPATDLSALLKDDIATKEGKVLTAFALWSWNRVFGAPLGPVLDPSGKPTVDKIASECIENNFEALAVVMTEKKINKNFLHGDVTQIEPWKSLLAKNSTGNAPAGAPVFLAQGTADTTVHPPVTLQAAKALCAKGTPVELDWLPGVNHNLAAVKSASAAVAWMGDRLQGKRAPNQCRRLPPEPKAPAKKSS